MRTTNHPSRLPAGPQQALPPQWIIEITTYGILGVLLILRWTGGPAACSTGRDIMANVLGVTAIVMVAVGMRFKFLAQAPSWQDRLVEWLVAGSIAAILAVILQPPCVAMLIGR
jgi:hypothetical protein